MEPELEPDIVDRVHADFGLSDDRTAIAELIASGNQGRLARCIVLAAGGSLERLRKLVQMAERDYRDVIVAGEYDDYREQLRDLRVSFLINLPNDAWISEVAVTVAKHGFRLVHVDSRPATVGPFNYTSDRGEGQATFSNGISTLVVEKRDRLWAISSGGLNLHRFGLDTAMSDEGRFRVQIDYLLSPAGTARAAEGSTNMPTEQDPHGSLRPRWQFSLLALMAAATVFAVVLSMMKTLPSELWIGAGIVVVVAIGIGIAFYESYRSPPP